MRQKRLKPQGDQIKSTPSSRTRNGVLGEEKEKPAMKQSATRDHGVTSSQFWLIGKCRLSAVGLGTEGQARSYPLHPIPQALGRSYPYCLPAALLGPWRPPCVCWALPAALLLPLLGCQQSQSPFLGEASQAGHRRAGYSATFTFA